MAKEISFNSDARASLKRALMHFANNAVKVTLVQKVEMW